MALSEVPPHPSLGVHPTGDRSSRRSASPSATAQPRFAPGARYDARMHRFARCTAAVMLGYYGFLYLAATVVLVRWDGWSPATLTYLAALGAAALLHALVVRQDLRSSQDGGVRPVVLAGFVVLPVLLALAAPPEPEFDFFLLLPAASIALASRHWSRRAVRRTAFTVVVVAGVVVLRALVVQPGWGLASFWACLVSFVSVVVLALLYVARDWIWSLLIELSEARDGIGEVAVAQERKRFAADLHDIQGHHLQAIAVQGELAAKLIDHDPQQARSLLAAVQDRARAALEETRAIVTDCREVSFLAELGDSCQLLEEAGVVSSVATEDEPEVDPAPMRNAQPGWSRGAVSFALDLDSGSSRLLGRVVREATTNLLRHSGNARLSVVLGHEDGQSIVTLRDSPGAGDAPRSAPTVLSEPGRGLADLAEKVGHAGGVLTYGPVPGGFEVRAALPRTIGDREEQS